MSMEHKKFIETLSQLAEIAPTKPPVGPSIRKATQPESVWRQGQELVIDHKKNSTLGVKVKRIKHKPQVCEDCHLVVVNRVVNKKIYQYPQRHWRESCENCRKTRNPETGVFDVDTEKSQPVFITFFLNRDK